MSKLSPLGQSMASLFTPEAAKLRSGQASAASGRAYGAGRGPGFKAGKSDKTGDSLGNPNGPGYEQWGKKKPSENGPAGEEPETSQGPGGKLVATSKQGPEFVRLSAGWEKLLLTQRKICEKAKALFSVLEGPETYAEKRKLIQLKSRGCIVDLDVQLTAVAPKDEEPGKKGA